MSALDFARSLPRARPQGVSRGYGIGARRRRRQPILANPGPRANHRSGILEAIQQLMQQGAGGANPGDASGLHQGFNGPNLFIPGDMSGYQTSGYLDSLGNLTNPLDQGGAPGLLGPPIKNPGSGTDFVGPPADSGRFGVGRRLIPMPHPIASRGMPQTVTHGRIPIGGMFHHNAAVRGPKNSRAALAAYRAAHVQQAHANSLNMIGTLRATRARGMRVSRF